MAPFARARVVSTSPLLVRVAGDTIDTPIHMRNTDLTVAVGNDVVLQNVDGRWSLAYRYSSV